MGRRRRSQKKVQTKKKATVSKQFKCPVCSNDETVTCKFDRDRTSATLTCRVCANQYQTTNVSYLTEPIDVFYEWLDRCEEENEAGDSGSDIDY